MATVTVNEGETFLANHYRFGGGTDGIVTADDAGHTVLLLADGTVSAAYVDINSYVAGNPVVVGTMVTAPGTLPPATSTYGDTFEGTHHGGVAEYAGTVVGDVMVGDGQGGTVALIEDATITYQYVEIYRRDTDPDTGVTTQTWDWGIQSFAFVNVFSGDDTVYLNSGDDYFVDTAGRLTLWAGDGDDWIVAYDGAAAGPRPTSSTARPATTGSTTNRTARPSTAALATTASG